MAMTIQELRDLRIQLNISQKEVGKALHYTTCGISAIENGKCNTDVNFLLAYEDFLADVMNGKRDVPRKARFIPNPVSREKVAELRTLREKLKITQKAAAQYINKTSAALRAKENGRCNMSQEEYDTLKAVYEEEEKYQRGE